MSHSKIVEYFSRPISPFSRWGNVLLLGAMSVACFDAYYLIHYVICVELDCSQNKLAGLFKKYSSLFVVAGVGNSGVAWYFAKVKTITQLQAIVLLAAMMPCQFLAALMLFVIEA